MPTFLVISKHSPENCPLFNEKKRKVNLAYLDKFDVWSKKYGIKMVGAWSVPNEHLNLLVIEAPSLEAFQKISMEPEAMAVGASETYEVKLALSIEEINKMLRQIK
jgi:hypothetical protein